MSDTKCECGGPHYWDGDPGEEYCSCCGGQKRLLDEIGRLRAEIERLVAALNREHDEVAGYRELLKLPLSPKATCPTCALVDEARRTIGGEGGA